jgi:hypothetical protein
MSGYYPGSIDVAMRIPAGGQDKRTATHYLADLIDEAEVSLMRSPSWRNGCPLLQEERWPHITSAALPRGDRPDKGRWAS